jgi:hypothetical protein
MCLYEFMIISQVCVCQIILNFKGSDFVMHIINILENTYMHACMQKPSPYWQNHYVFWTWSIERSCHGNTIILRIVLKLKNSPNISLLIMQWSISQTYICQICYYTEYKLQSNVKFNHKRLTKRFKMFLKLNCLLWNYKHWVWNKLISNSRI